jgi:transcriptional regulator with XRE-family HTH domain
LRIYTRKLLKVRENFQTALGLRIRELRKLKGYSQESFADYCGVHRTFMGTLERGESNLSFSNLVKISKALKITLSELLEGIEKRADQLAENPQETAAPQ